MPQPEYSITELKCYECGLMFPLMEYTKNPRSPRGYSYNCRRCTNRFHKGIIYTSGDRTCPICGETKPLDGFIRNLNHKSGWSYPCKECTKKKDHARYYKNHKLSRLIVNTRNYGLSVDEYTALMTSNEGICPICNTEPITSIDHCHATGKVRGAICRRCNWALGAFGDDPLTILSGLLYLKPLKQTLLHIAGRLQRAAEDM